MQDRVDRVALEAHDVVDVVAEGGRVGGQLDEGVQRLGAVAHAEQVAGLAEAAGGEAVAVRQREPVAVEPLEQSEDARTVLRVALVVATVALQHARRTSRGRRRRCAARPARARPSRTPRAAPRARARGSSSRRSRRSSDRGRSSCSTPSSARIASASRTIESARKWARYSACSAALRSGSVPTGVERPVPRWSSISTRKSSSARSSQPGELGCRVGRAASWPGPPWRKTRKGRSRPSGSAISRANTPIEGPPGRA